MRHQNYIGKRTISNYAHDNRCCVFIYVYSICSAYNQKRHPDAQVRSLIHRNLHFAIHISWHKLLCLRWMTLLAHWPPSDPEYFLLKPLPPRSPRSPGLVVSTRAITSELGSQGVSITCTSFPVTTSSLPWRTPTVEEAGDLHHLAKNSMLSFLVDEGKYVHERYVYIYIYMCVCV